MTLTTWKVLWLALLLGCMGQDSDLMGPGTLAPYVKEAGGTGGQEKVVVTQPAAGFFIAGSSIKEMNGCYQRVRNVHVGIEHTVIGAYRKWRWGDNDDLTGWTIALVQTPQEGSGIEPIDPTLPDEWLIIDPSFRDRFGHKGDTRSPGPYKKWKHLYRQADKDSNGTSLATQADDSELPRQIVFIQTFETVFRLRREHREHEDRLAGVRQAESRTCRKSGGDTCPGGGRDVPLPQDALNAFMQGNYTQAASLYTKELTRECDECETSGVDAFWRAAVLRRAKAECLRRAGQHVQAVEELGTVLSLYPKYEHALMELALTLMDAGRPAQAMTVMTKLHKLDRWWPGLEDRMVQAYGADIRAVMHPQGHDRPQGDKMSTHFEHEMNAAIRHAGFAVVGRPVIGHYQVLGVSCDHTADELRQAYRARSKETHPDRGGGHDSEDAFTKVAIAYEVLGDAAKRAEYDDGEDVDLKGVALSAKTVREAVLRRYYPERFEYLPFGDPMDEQDESTAQAAL